VPDTLVLVRAHVDQLLLDLLTTGLVEPNNVHNEKDPTFLPNLCIFENDEKTEIVDYIVENRAKMRELSLRTVLKVADLRKSFTDNWKAMAEVTVMKRGSV
jgi:hypothetical protein